MYKQQCWDGAICVKISWISRTFPPSSASALEHTTVAICLAGFTVMVHCRFCRGNNRFSSSVCQMRNPAAPPASPSSHQSLWRVHLSFNSSLPHKFDMQQHTVSRRSTLTGHPTKSPFPFQKRIYRKLIGCMSKRTIMKGHQGTRAILNMSLQKGQSQVSVWLRWHRTVVLSGEAGEERGKNGHVSLLCIVCMLSFFHSRLKQ